MHTHRERAQARMCTHVCERGRGAFGRAARTHRPDDGAIPILGAHGCAQTERSPRRERPLPRTQHTRQAATEGVGEERRIGGRAAFTARAHRGRRARAPLSRRSRLGPLEPGGRRPGFPGEKCGTPRRAHQLLSCDGLSGVNGSVASRGVSAAYTIHVRVYIFTTARAAAAHLAEREASQRPRRVASSKRSYTSLRTELIARSGSLHVCITQQTAGMLVEQVPLLCVRAGLINSPSYARRREHLEV